MQLHASVSADQWGVSKQDMRSFFQAVRKAVETRSIVPSGLDNFDVDDAKFGPSIYTVNEQFIKPVTMAAGGMSWSLMLNPHGSRPCDLFITHAWMEGAYEFLDKVMSSWPPSARCAWCCMLAIPQNLRISEFISCPSRSPFAVALRSSKCVLVVPNRHESVYTRMWCTYEAYLAHKWDKVILTAGSSVVDDMFSALVLIACGMALGLLSSLAWPLYMSSPYLADCYMVDALSLAMLLILSTCATPGRQFVNCFGFFASTHLIGILYNLHHAGYKPTCDSLAQPLGYTRWSMKTSPLTDVDERLIFQWFCLQVVIFVNFVIFFSVAEMDRVRSKHARREANQLRRGYTGSILEAACSNSSDALNILADVGSDIGQVDKTIQVLIDSGMSTRRLREAERYGVDVKQAAYVEYSAAWACMFFVTYLMCIKNLNKDLPMNYTYYPMVGTVLLAATWLYLFLFRSRDARAFAQRVMQRFTALFLIPFVLIVFELTDLRRLTKSQEDVAVTSTCFVCFLLIVLLSAAGLHRIARIPFVGPCLAQFLAARSCWDHCPSCRKRNLRKVEPEMSSDIESED
eukprot:TRINITY_DN7962_c0_g8_i1.p1 TRINITY_DN7962_c0_g8~~TRINITY_DN7962_c0_g8_i1.p1  ORF type:complete len:607 (+),score=57.46 TRINITY_DN7962_c0_g8_i1:104-1822(+)